MGDNVRRARREPRRRMGGRMSPTSRGEAPQTTLNGAYEPLPEGEEAPPPGTRTMGLVRWSLVALMALAAAAAWLHWSGVGGNGGSAAAVQYHCPMHPSVVTDHRGECPICGMDLVAIAAAKPEPASTGGAAPAAKGAYWCPMHPEVASDDPNATCPKCSGMRLMPRPAAESAKAGVPGLVPVDIAPERVQRIGMRTAVVARERLAPSLRTVGIVTADEGSIAVVSSRLNGWVEKVLVSQSGQRVRKGEVLARVFSPEVNALQAAYITAVKWSAGQGGASTPETESRTRMRAAGFVDEDLDEIARAGTPLRTIPIRSPVDGYVGKKGAVVGLYVTPGLELFEIADLSTVWVLADVYEAEMDRVRVGQKGTLELPAFPGQVFAGRVQFVYPAVSTGSRTLKARLAFRNRGLRLRPGMFANVTLELEGIEGLVVPSEAVVDSGEVQYVFVSRDGGRFEPRRVRLGSRSDARVQVLEGVAEGERVVTTANFLIDSESRMRAAIEGFASREEARASPDAGGGAAALPEPGHGTAAAPHAR